MYKETISGGYSTETGTAYTYAYQSYCAYRLPCGYCKELGKTCPYIGTTQPIVTWTTGATDCHSNEVNHD